MHALCSLLPVHRVFPANEYLGDQCVSLKRSDNAGVVQSLAWGLQPFPFQT
jgi:hypothetical protein